MNRLLTATIGLAAVALALTACGTEEPPDSKGGPTETVSESEGGGDVPEGDFRNAPVPGADPQDAWEKDLPAEPDREAPFGDKIEYELLEAAGDFTHQLDDKAKIECPDVKGDKDEDITCEGKFFGQEISWKVAITGGSVVANYKYEADQAVVSREYLENALRFKADTEDVLCELDAEYTAVDPAKIDPITCHSLKDGAQTVWQVRVGGTGSTTFSER